MPKLRAVDLFSGAGGLSLGLTQAGIEVVLANEIEADFAATHAHNHPECAVVTEDIYKVDFDAALRRIKCRGAVDLLCGGPPCQGFSTVGKKELTDPRNSLFAQFLRVVDQISPRFVLFENARKCMFVPEIPEYRMPGRHSGNDTSHVRSENKTLIKRSVKEE